LFRNKFAMAAALPEIQATLVVIVPAASELNPIYRSRAAQSIRIDVVELHGPPLTATVAARCHERATAQITHPHGPLHRRRRISARRPHRGGRLFSTRSPAG